MPRRRRARPRLWMSTIRASGCSASIARCRSGASCTARGAERRDRTPQRLLRRARMPVVVLDRLDPRVDGGGGEPARPQHADLGAQRAHVDVVTAIAQLVEDRREREEVPARRRRVGEDAASRRHPEQLPQRELGLAPGQAGVVAQQLPGEDVRHRDELGEAPAAVRGAQALQRRGEDGRAPVRVVRPGRGRRSRPAAGARLLAPACAGRPRPTGS